MGDFDFLDIVEEVENPFSGNAADFLSKDLNPNQKIAVEHGEGPLLILAGAGSGKTRVITYRIAYLIQVKRIHPSSILAITFTNKAAAEMKERVRDLVGDLASQMWIGTFHSMFARILRRHADLLGFQRNFNILDTDDQLKVVKTCISELNLNDKIFVPRSVQSAISRAKNEMEGPKAFSDSAGNDYNRKKISEVYKKYQEKLLVSNSMDFDDILFFGVKLFSENPDILAHYQELFQYILVDEYQDTNFAQYQFIQLLAKKYRNLCVVGDDDQSIYSFRGANIRNILDFEKDFKDTAVIKLEQNYRSTSNVLGAANSIIKNNSGRKDKKLWTEMDAGERITYYVADHHGLEAWFAVNQIQKWVKSKGGSYSDIAILYRVNALSRTIEGALREQGVPYRIYGGFRFYDRKEIKDVLAYLRLVASSLDNYAFDRVVNVPKRGIGDSSLLRIHEIAEEEGISCLQVCAKAQEYPSLSRISHKLTQFSWLIQEFREKLSGNDVSFSDYIEFVQDRSGLVQEILEQKEKKGDTVDRIEILRELLSEAVEFENRRKEEESKRESLSSADNQETPDRFSSEDISYTTDLPGLLQAYLENAALYSEGDNQSEDEDFVRVLTIHSAKGLEFPVVFIIGVEEGIFPGHRSMDSEASMEEERRLAYVAVTRARKKLFITTARSRMLFGQTQQLLPSRFIKEIDEEYLDVIGSSRTEFSERNTEYERGQVVSKTQGDGRKPFASLYSGGMSVQKSSAPSKEESFGFLQPEQVQRDMRVRHPRFGTGKVLTVEPVAGDALVCILFDNKTKKNMLAKQAKLTAE